MTVFRMRPRSVGKSRRAIAWVATSAPDFYSMLTPYSHSGAALLTKFSFPADRRERIDDGRRPSRRPPRNTAIATPRQPSSRRALAHEVSAVELLELEVDVRLAALWAELARFDELTLEVVAAFLRAAYAQGYCDVLAEDVPGELCRAHARVIREQSG